MSKKAVFAVNGITLNSSFGKDGSLQDYLDEKFDDCV